MFRRHFFLILAVLVIAGMAVAAGVKILGKPSGAPGGPGPGAAAGGRGGGGAPGGASGRGGGGRGGTLVTPATVAMRVFTDRLQVLGVAKGRQSVTLTTSAGQMVDKVNFKSGDHVRAGQVLLELRRGAEDASLVQAKTAADLAKMNAERWSKLADQGIAARATADQYQSAYVAALGALDAAQARLADRVIIAPFAGVVGLSDIAPGALISPGTAIATLDDVSVMTVDMDVPDRYLQVVQPGTAIDATTEAYPGVHYSGRIAKIDSRIDERTRAFKARAELPNPGGQLKPGMLMRVGIDRSTHQGLAVPESAVLFTGNEAAVYLISGPAAGSAGPSAPAGAATDGPAGRQGRAGGQGGGGLIAIQRPIVAGINECGFVEVSEGLQLGDRVVANGLNKVQPNQSITLAGGGGGGRGERGGAAMDGAPGGGRADANGASRGGAPGAAAPAAGRPGAAAGGAGARGGQARGGAGPAVPIRPAACPAQQASGGGSGATPAGGRGPGAPDRAASRDGAAPPPGGGGRGTRGGRGAAAAAQ